MLITGHIISQVHVLWINRYSSGIYVIHGLFTDNGPINTIWYQMSFLDEHLISVDQLNQKKKKKMALNEYWWLQNQSIL